MSQKNREKKKKLNRKYLRLDKIACEKMIDLFQFVNNLNKSPDIALRGGVYREMAKADSFITSFNGWEVGYKIEDHKLFMRRKVFLKCEQPLKELEPHKKEPVLTSAFDIFFEKGGSLPDIDQISEYAFLMQQDVIGLELVEKNPRLISKGPLITKH